MNLKKLLTYVASIFVALSFGWWLADPVWLTRFSVACTLLVISWTLGYYCYDLWNRETVEKPDEKAILVTGCDTGFGHETAIKLDRLGKWPQLCVWIFGTKVHLKIHRIPRFRGLFKSGRSRGE